MQQSVLNLKKLMQKKSTVVFTYAFLLVMAAVSFIMKPGFLSAVNLKNLVNNAMPYMLVSFAQTIVIISGGIDLSTGGIICLANVIFASFANNEPWGVPAAFAASITAGIAAGFLNGLIVTKGRLPPLIVTLATASIFAGLALTILPQPGGGVPAELSKAVMGDAFLRIPLSLLLLILLAAVLWNVLNNTKYGRGVFAVGGSETNAFYSGLPINRTKLITYALSGFLCSLSGIFIAIRMVSGDPLIGLNMPLISVTTSVIGGTSLAGGKGGISGTIAGVFILLIISNMLNFLGIPAFYQHVMQGAILILALAAGSLRYLSRGSGKAD